MIIIHAINKKINVFVNSKTAPAENKNKNFGNSAKIPARKESIRYTTVRSKKQRETRKIKRKRKKRTKTLAILPKFKPREISSAILRSEAKNNEKQEKSSGKEKSEQKLWQFCQNSSQEKFHPLYCKQKQRARRSRKGRKVNHYQKVYFLTVPSKSVFGGFFRPFLSFWVDFRPFGFQHLPFLPTIKMYTF